MDVPPARRSEVLNEACAGDPELRAEVERLLGEASDASGFLEAPAVEQITLAPGDLTAGVLAPVGDALLGQRIGAYRIDAEVGRGGMGTVYRAVREDGAFLQEVALKVVNRGLDAPELFDRFRRERQILAMLNHPNIARILDGGSIPDGRPFYAMEFVEGEPVTQYCYSRKLSLHDRLRLFRSICDAVAHAHQNLIIHRDLKPANIFVTKDGVVKLLDFGIAKIFFSDMPDLGQTLAVGAALLTPNYASPEQVRNERITTATDVYALGLILYELLTGKRAQQVASATPGEIERAVCEGQPTRPSVAAGPDGVSPASRLRGDLETILLKAIQKDPARRYGTVNQLAEDLDRYLTGRPVSARPDSVWYRTRMFVRRNKLAVGAAAVVLASLVAGITIAVWQARIAREHFNSVRTLARSLFDEINPAIMDVPGATKARHIIVTRSVEYLDKLSAAAGSDPEILREAAEAYEAIAEVQGNRNRHNLGNYAGALASYRKALALRGRIEKIAPSLTNRRWIAMITANASRVYPNSEEALTMARSSVAMAAQVRNDNNPQYRHVYPNTLFGLGYILTMREEAEEAVAQHTKAREIFVAINRPTNSWSLMDRYIAGNLRLLGRPGEALFHAQRAVQIDEQRVARRSTPRERMDLSYDYQGLAQTLAELGRWQEALPPAEKSRAIRIALAAADPNDNRARTAVPDIEEILGFVYAGLGQRASALNSLTRAITSREEIVRAAPESSEDQYELARGYMTSGLVDRMLGRCAEAEVWFAKARPILASLNRRLSLKRIDNAPVCRKP